MLNKNNNFKKEKVIPSFIFFMIFVVLFVGLIVSFLVSIFGGTKGSFFGGTIAITILCLFSFFTGIFHLIRTDEKHRMSIKALGVVLLLTSFAFMSILIDYYKDVPKIINSEYSSYEGELTSFHVSHGRSTSTNLTIGNRTFEMSGEFSDKNFLIIGGKYRVEFLPNTKYVMNLYRYGNYNKILK